MKLCLKCHSENSFTDSFCIVCKSPLLKTPEKADRTSAERAAKEKADRAVAEKAARDRAVAEKAARDRAERIRIEEQREKRKKIIIGTIISVSIIAIIIFSLNNTSSTTKTTPTSATTQSTVTRPNTPTNVTASALSSTSIQISWNTVTGATSYRIYYSSTRTGSFADYYTSTTTSYTDSAGINAGSTWYYKVSALNSAGRSATASTTSATTQRATTITTTSSIVGTNWEFINQSDNNNRYRLAFPRAGIVALTIHNSDASRLLETVNGTFTLQNNALTIEFTFPEGREVQRFTYTPQTSIVNNQNRSIVYRPR